MPKFKTQGDRCKFFEQEFGQGKYIMPGLPAISRIDGRAFHSFTRGLDRPFDKSLSDLMISTTEHLVKETHADLGYCQSDEISLLWMPKGENSEIFFDGRVQKMTSVLAAIATEYFNQKIPTYLPKKIGIKNKPVFDSRVWAVPNLEEVYTYFDWRQKDAVKNSISMSAQSVFSHTELHKKNSSHKQDMLFSKGINWNNYPDQFKRGTFVSFMEKIGRFSEDEIFFLPKNHDARKNPDLTYSRRLVELVWPNGKGEIKTLLGVKGEL